MIGSTPWSELVGIVLLSLLVSGTAVALAAATALPLGTLVGLSRFRGRSLLMRILYTLMGLPSTVVGLVVYVFLASQGPMGSLGLLFTPSAMILAQWVLVTPIITGLVAVAVEDRDRRYRETAAMLGATPWQTRFLVLREARPAVFAAIAGGLGRALGELGAVNLVGGNIRYATRVMTTSIMLETRRGNFAAALTLGGILLVMSFVLNFVVYSVQQRGRR